MEKVEAERVLLGIPLAPDSLVFCNYDGSPMLANSVTHAYLKIARKVGLQGVRLHDARHTHASLMLAANVHPKIVQERLGHSSISITLDTYSHAVPGIQEMAALGFDQAVGHGGVTQTFLDSQW